jgi:transcriptional regulator with XRE-family HTH domain
MSLPGSQVPYILSVGIRESRTAIRDVARLAGVSVTTVSRVLNDRRDVAPATRRAVLEVVARERFRPNASARGLPHGRTTSRRSSPASPTRSRTPTRGCSYFRRAATASAKHACVIGLDRAPPTESFL